MSTEIEAWLARNAIRCPLGRLTRAQCDANRRRPTVLQWIRREHQKGRPDQHVRFRPRQCEDCSGWEGYVDPVLGAEGEEQVAVKMITCPECGKEKKHFCKGLCAACYGRVNYDHIKALKKARQEAKKAAVSAGEAPLSDAQPLQPAPKKAGNVNGSGSRAIRSPDGGQKIVIDFSGCEELLEKLQTVACRNDRTVELQGRFAIRCWLETFDRREEVK